MGSIRWLWFDLDDTLYNFQTSSLIALDCLYERHNLSRFFPDSKCWKIIYHRFNDALWERYNVGLVDQQTLRRERFVLPLLEMGVDEGEAIQLAKQLDKEYLKEIALTGLTIPGALDLLKEAKRRGYKIGILSNGFSEVQYDKLRSTGLIRYVDCVVLSDEIGINKPDIKLFEYALAKSGATAEESIMIGDNPTTDIAGAQSAGWETLLFNKERRFDDLDINQIYSLDADNFFSKL